MGNGAPHPQDATSQERLRAALDDEPRAFEVGIQADDPALIALRAQPARAARSDADVRERARVA